MCCWPHTVQSLGHALPALCRTHVGLNDVLLSLCPSLPSLRRRLLPFVVRLVHWYCGTVRLLLYVHVRRAVFGLRGPVLITRPRRAGDLPVLVHVVSQRARVLRLRRTEQSPRDNVVAVLPSSTRKGVGVLFHRLFEAHLPGPPIPLSTLQGYLAISPARLEARIDSLLSFPVG